MIWRVASGAAALPIAITAILFFAIGLDHRGTIDAAFDCAAFLACVVATINCGLTALGRAA